MNNKELDIKTLKWNSNTQQFVRKVKTRNCLGCKENKRTTNTEKEYYCEECLKMGGKNWFEMANGAVITNLKWSFTLFKRLQISWIKKEKNKD